MSMKSVVKAAALQPLVVATRVFMKKTKVSSVEQIIILLERKYIKRVKIPNQFHT